MPQAPNRRDFVKTTTASSVAAVTMPYWWSAPSAFAQSNSPNERPTIGCIGTGDRWKSVGPQAFEHADCVALCDVDANHLEQAKTRTANYYNGKGRDVGGDISLYENFRDLLDQDGIDIVTVVTPDHWHTLPVIEALKAGKDIYAEKPLTLTIHEGKQIVKTLAETDRVVQVGTQQRTGFGRLFLKAVAMVRQGRIGDVRKITCCINGSGDSGVVPAQEVPQGLNWDMWLGQAPEAEFRLRELPAREDGRQPRPLTNCHYNFRWWYEYSGGKMTDWGAHHVDIATWAIRANQDGMGPLTIDPLESVHPVEFVDGMPTERDRYNAATRFDVKLMFAPTEYAPEGCELHIVSHSADGNGILFEGTKGRFHVSRRRMKGKPFEDLETNPLPDGALEEVYGRPLPRNHMVNFFDCVKSRETPISDVPSHVRSMNTLHLSNIAVRLNRSLRWDAATENIVDDAQAQSFQKRDQRPGYEIDVDV